MKSFFVRIQVIFLLILCNACAYTVLPKNTLLYMTGDNLKLQKRLQAEIKAGKKTTANLFWLCSSCLNLRQYDQLLACSEELEINIKKGDTCNIDYSQNSPSMRQWMAKSLAGPLQGQCDVSPWPHIYRSWAYIDFGQYEHAIEQAKQGYNKKIKEGYMQNWNRMNALAPLGIAYSLNGNKQEALKVVNEIKDIQFRDGDTGLKAERNIFLSRIYFASKDYKKVLEISNQGTLTARRQQKDATTRFSSIDSSIFRRQILSEDFIISKSLMEIWRIQDAKRGYEQILSLPQIRDNGEIYWMTLYDRGRISENEGNIRDAIGYYISAVDVIEQQRSTINTEASKIGFVGDKQAVYHNLVRALYREHQYERAFEYVERSKSRALVDLLASKKDFALKVSNKEEIKEILAVNDRADMEVISADEAIDKSKSRSVIIKIREELRGKAPELASLVTVTSLPVAELRTYLQEDEVLIEYYYYDREMYVFVLSEKGLFTLQLDSEGLNDDVRKFRKDLEDSTSSRFINSSKRIYERLIKPIESNVNRKNLIIVPHGTLHYLPFNALYDGGDFLIDRHSVRVMPSASTMKYVASRKARKTGDILAFGNPDLGESRYHLPFAEKEAIDVAKSRLKSRVFLRKEATLNAFLRNAGNYNYIHFATHGQFDSAAPLKSAILLAPEGGSNGMLTMDKLYSLDLSADLVTLSGCETGLGKIANGDELVGLTRGFLYAGSTSIVASLWKVDDLATSQLMISFYHKLSKINKRDALRAAQLEARRKIAHPWYWASFQLTGSAY